MSVRILQGDCREVLKTLPDESVHCVVTSPPYFGLRDYGTALWIGGDAGCEHREPRGDPSAGVKQKSNAGSVGRFYKQKCEICGSTRVDNQIGLEATPDAFVAEMVAVFREVRRVLRSDGVAFLNLGDSYANDGKWGGHTGGKHVKALHCSPIGRNKRYTGLKPKDLVGIPWRVAFALQADGWWLRQDIIWSKPNPMPESVTDRCTKAHEYLFMFAKSERYFFDAKAIRNPPSEALLKQVSEGYNGRDTKDYGVSGAQSASGTKTNIIRRAREKIDKQRGHGRRHAGFNDRWDSLSKEEQQAIGSNKRSVWEIATAPFSEAHFATFPPALIEPCIKAGCPKGGTVLDPFFGVGTTGLVADRLGRNCIGIELNATYAEMAERRIHDDSPLFAGAMA